MFVTILQNIVKYLDPYTNICGYPTMSCFVFSAQVYDFTVDDLIDQGEIGHGNYGTVSKMYHKASGTVMAVKVSMHTTFGFFFRNFLHLL